ncbi:MAG: tetratricopeptide repeat protein [Deferribacteres bacterium]|nr:tetratricopeptide repeat protein [candidate division KSB1 bacterium]MCB9503297.1 tetratricopeptide repeat protein [Deferribacteres bacterium]
MRSQNNTLLFDHISALHRCLTQRDDAQNAERFAILEPLIEVLAQPLIPSNNIEMPSSESYAIQMMQLHLELMHASFLHLQQSSQGNSSQARFHLLFGEMYQLLGNPQQAELCYERLIDHSTETEHANLHGTGQLKMGQLHIELGELDNATRFFQTAEAVLYNAGNLKNGIIAKIELAKIAYRKGEYVEAEKLFRNALEDTVATHDKYHEAVILNQLGVISRLRGDLEEARSRLQEALVCFQSVNDRFGEAECWNNLGRIYFQQKNFTAALSSYDKAIELCQTSGTFTLKAFVSLNKCDLYLYTNDLPLAVIACRNALDIFVRLKNPTGIARASKMLGTIAWKSGNITQAEQCFEIVLDFYRQINIPLGLVDALTEYADYLKKNGKMNAGKKALEEAYKIRMQLGMHEAETNEVNGNPSLDQRYYTTGSAQTNGISKVHGKN